jgi:hypothetical protein
LGGEAVKHLDREDRDTLIVSALFLLFIYLLS